MLNADISRELRCAQSGDTSLIVAAIQQGPTFRWMPWTQDADFEAMTAYFQPSSEDENFNIVCHERLQHAAPITINAYATITESAVIENCEKSLKVPKHGFTRLFVNQRKSANEGGGLIVIESK